MAKEHATKRVDVTAFAAAEDERAGETDLSHYARLAAEALPDAAAAPVRWTATGGFRAGADGVRRPALHLVATAQVPQVCQRCLQRVDTLLAVDCHFLFARDEKEAAALDAESEDDVLALTDALDLDTLVEDELILALPMIPHHEHCPVALPRRAETPDFAAAQDRAEHPFAILGKPRVH